MSRGDSRAYREAQEDNLWRTVWQIWPEALTYEDDTPFDRAAKRFRLHRRDRRQA